MLASLTVFLVLLPTLSTCDNPSRLNSNIAFLVYYLPLLSLCPALASSTLLVPMAHDFHKCFTSCNEHRCTWYWSLFMVFKPVDCSRPFKDCIHISNQSVVRLAVPHRTSREPAVLAMQVRNDSSSKFAVHFQVSFTAEILPTDINGS